MPNYRNKRKPLERLGRKSSKQKNNAILGSNNNPKTRRGLGKKINHFLSSKKFMKLNSQDLSKLSSS